MSLRGIWLNLVIRKYFTFFWFFRGSSKNSEICEYRIRISKKNWGEDLKIFKFGFDLKVKWELVKDFKKDVIIKDEVGKGGNIKNWIFFFFYSYNFC